jgi:hypothetical protein
MVTSSKTNHVDKGKAHLLSSISEAPETEDVLMSEETAKKFVHSVSFQAKVDLAGNNAETHPATIFIRKVLAFVSYEVKDAIFTTVKGEHIALDDFPTTDDATKNSFEFDVKDRQTRNFAFAVKISTDLGFYPLRDKILDWLKHNQIYMRNMPLKTAEVHVVNIGILTGINPYIVHRGDYERELNANITTTLKSLDPSEFKTTFPHAEFSPDDPPYLRVFKRDVFWKATKDQSDGKSNPGVRTCAIGIETLRSARDLSQFLLTKIYPISGNLSFIPASYPHDQSVKEPEKHYKMILRAQNQFLISTSHTFVLGISKATMLEGTNAANQNLKTILELHPSIVNVHRTMATPTHGKWLIETTTDLITDTTAYLDASLTDIISTLDIQEQIPNISISRAKKTQVNTMYLSRLALSATKSVTESSTHSANSLNKVPNAWARGPPKNLTRSNSNNSLNSTHSAGSMSSLSQLNTAQTNSITEKFTSSIDALTKRLEQMEARLSKPTPTSVPTISSHEAAMLKMMEVFTTRLESLQTKIDAFATKESTETPSPSPSIQQQVTDALTATLPDMLTRMIPSLVQQEISNDSTTARVLGYADSPTVEQKRRRKTPDHQDDTLSEDWNSQQPQASQQSNPPTVNRLSTQFNGLPYTQSPSGDKMLHE